MAIIQPCITSTSFYHQNFGSNKKFTHPPKFTTININRSCKPPLITCSTNNNTNVLLFEAAKHTVDTYLRSGMVVGLGSGIASAFAIKYLGHKLHVGLLKDVVGIPTTVGSATEAEKAGIPLHQYQNSSQIDFAFNDADIMEERSLNAVIRHQRLQGGESMIEETKILDVTENLVLMVTDRQYKSAVEGSIPVFVNAVSWMDTAEEIDDLFVGDAETVQAVSTCVCMVAHWRKKTYTQLLYTKVWRRPSIGHADPMGGNFPLVTREGHNVLDVIFTSPIPNLAEVAKLLNNIDGVAGHGIITKTPCTAVVSTESGLCIIENTLHH